MKIHQLTGLLFFPCACFAEKVTLDYEAEASTVVGTPFGLTVPRLSVVTGTLVYETDGATDLNGTPERGHYQLGGGGGFTASFLDGEATPHLLQGSAGPWLEVENIPSVGDSTIDTFRFWDGDDSDSKGGLMSLDGTVSGDYFLTFAMTDGSGAAFENDTLPAPYPMTGVKGPIGYPFPHTFVIGDGNGSNGTGRMLLQLTRLSQRPVETEGPSVRGQGFMEGAFTIDFDSKEGERYAIEFSTDLESWDVIATGVPATGDTTSYSDTEVKTRIGRVPGAAYYRVRVVPDP